MEKDIDYAKAVVKGQINAPKYVKKQCREYLKIVSGKDKTYMTDSKKREQIIGLTKLLKIPRGLSAGKTVYETLAGFQWMFLFATMTVVHRSEPTRRRYQTAILEICRKNGKTFLIAIVFLVLFFTEPQFSKFYSVAPNGMQSREIQQQIKEIIACSPALKGKFKVRRDDILCLLNQNDYVPLAFSTSEMDGKLPNAFVADEVGALPVNYPIEAMRSGQLMIQNKLGCIISTKYPTIENPFEDEVRKAKQVLDGALQDDTVFSLLYEPDKTKDWETDDGLIAQSNPLALEIPAVFEDIRKKRTDAIVMPSTRENFLTKHLNIIYQGLGTETYIDPQDVIACRSQTPIDWTGKTVYVGVDLSETTDNTAVAFVALDNDGETILADVVGFIPADSVDSKSRTEKVPYRQFIEDGKCIDCGGRVIDYSVVEEFVFALEERLGCSVAYIGYDRRNAMSSAQKWDEKYETVEIRQHSSVLHAPTKLLRDSILEGLFRYDENRFLELNFQNARVTYDTNRNLYVNKKKSSGKVDMVVALINAVYLLQTFELQGDGVMDWAVMV
ncbi:MAG: terminase TerL endonuclease subunit [Acutalibacteraceae bacterium]|nr:terminase TerL endonuclease subunit [Acutalibacteraceae bacterium]